MKRNLLMWVLVAWIAFWLGATGGVLSSAHAQGTATVVATCGTVPQPFAAGSTRAVVMDINGNLCTAGGSAASAVGITQGGNTAQVKAGNTAVTTDQALVVADPNVVAAVNQGVATAGNAPPAQVIYFGANASGATGGHIAGLIQCDSKATYDASTTGSTRVITGISGRNIYICGVFASTGVTATNVKLVEGTRVTTDCDTGAANMTPAVQLAANDKWGMNSPFFNGIKTATIADDVCVNSSAANAVQWIILYTIL